MRVCVAHPGVRVRAYIPRDEGAHKGIVPLYRISRRLWGLVSGPIIPGPRLDSRREFLESMDSYEKSGVVRAREH